MRRRSLFGNPRPLASCCGLVALGVLVAALATSFPLKLMAQSCSCSEPDCTCPPDALNCFIDPALQEPFCCGCDDVGCASPLLSWCCPNGTNRYGDNGECY